MSCYQLLPFRFDRFNNNEYLLTNDAGEFIFLENKDFLRFVKGDMRADKNIFYNLKSRQFATDQSIEPIITMLATKVRTKKSNLNDFTTLHMVVPTLRCNSNCIYCQVSKKNLTDKNVDMTQATANNVIKTIFNSPAKSIKVEFQGGEPLTNYKMVQYIIEESEWFSYKKKKNVEFVLCTNLSLITPKILKYLKKHKCYISTSLDGTKDIHNKNRPLQTLYDSHKVFEDTLVLSKNILGNEYVSALMTTTCYSLGHFTDIINEYLRLGFRSIFLRSLNPYGFAKRDKHLIAYPISEFIDNYKKALSFIIDLNKNGTFFVEGYAELIINRILTPFATGFVDLQSPAGVGISGVIYDYNGNVYVSDEGRMLAAVNDYRFEMGNVNQNTYDEIFNSEFMHSLISSACTECLPACAECVYQPFCGADPVRNYSEQGDIVGHRPTSDICKKNKEIIKHILSIVRENDKDVMNVFWSWINRKPVELNRESL
ncbi:MAG: His-Xaa-Ser system radical SAM maturase HxsB [Campylobacteraceae bacterium]|jgi:His-Xaa-Ser system radical SAM maturase HxsB|nr:His-Xaa-Ser system radical SAM maturase HxsB [Campylobacteraceae bacterium]